jgi:hypothetical protein
VISSALWKQLPIIFSHSRPSLQAWRPRFSPIPRFWGMGINGINHGLASSVPDTDDAKFKIEFSPNPAR